MLKQLARHPLRREITIVLLIKLALIAALKIAFFSNPPAQSLTRADIGRHLISTPVDQTFSTLQGNSR